VTLTYTFTSLAGSTEDVGFLSNRLACDGKHCPQLPPTEVLRSMAPLNVRRTERHTARRLYITNKVDRTYRAPAYLEPTWRSRSRFATVRCQHQGWTTRILRSAR